MRLFLVRHGATRNNIEDRYTGQADVDLSSLGREQAAAAGWRLAPERLDAIVTSDLRRARDTARAVARHHALPVLEDADLREVALGEWEGVLFAKVAAFYPEQLKSWQADPARHAPPGGETVIQVRDRVVRALHRWQETYPAGNVLWVSHGGVIGIVLCHLLGMSLHRRIQFRCANASISAFEVGSDPATLLYFNETAHLRALRLETPGSVRHQEQGAVL